MVYKVIGLMSGSSLDGLDIAYVHLQEAASTIKDSPKKWEFTILEADTYPYPDEWRRALADARHLSALEYQLLHTRYGRYIGEQVLHFIETHQLHYQVQLIASHGHTVFHDPGQRMTAQLGDGAALAATTGINVVSDLRAMDVALGGQGAPIVPVGERLLLPDHAFFLNLGGIANISAGSGPGLGSGGSSVSGGGSPHQQRMAFDVCPANRVLNELASMAGKAYDEGGALAAGGALDEDLLQALNDQSYYARPYPKSLANEFGTETILPLVLDAIAGMAGEGVDQAAEGGIAVEDALRTYVEHIAVQVRRAVEGLLAYAGEATDTSPLKMLITGGGAHNTFLVARLRETLASMGVEVVVPDGQLVDFKEALVMALIGVLRWREENNVFAAVTGASRDSIGGAVWIGQDA